MVPRNIFVLQSLLWVYGTEIFFVKHQGKGFKSIKKNTILGPMVKKWIFLMINVNSDEIVWLLIHWFLLIIER